LRQLCVECSLAASCSKGFVMFHRLALAMMLLLMVAAAAASACSSTPTAPGGDAGAKDVTEVPDARDGAVHEASVGLTCGQLLACDMPCSSNACTNACYARATGYAQGLLNAFSQCIADNCPAGDGGPCESGSSATCSSCNEQAGTGPCVSILLACSSDKHVGPPDPDGGGAIPYDAGLDAGSHLSCGAITACQQACAPSDKACQKKCFDEGTSTAQALSEAVANCVAIACPSTDGGVCAVAGTACSGCESEADFGGCGPPFNACQSDKSGMDGGSTEPVALHGGTVSLLVPGLSEPVSALPVINGQVYFSEAIDPGPVLSLPVDGGAVATITSGQVNPVGISIDTNNAYVWCTGTFSGKNALNNSDGTVLQIPLAGGATTTLATGNVVAYDAPYLDAVTHDTSNVYWVSGGPGTSGAINVAPIGGGSAASVLYGGQAYPEGVITYGTNLYWINWGTFDAKGDYNNDGAILTAASAGGSTPVTLASKQSAPAAMVTDGTNLYWTNVGQLTPDGLAALGTGSVMQVSLTGGTPKSLVSGQSIPLGLAVSGSTVYWAEFSLAIPGSINSVPVGGGALTTIVGNATDPFGVALVGGTIFWMDSPPSGIGNGSLYSYTP
jgi:hypothetical protein